MGPGSGQRQHNEIRRPALVISFLDISAALPRTRCCIAARHRINLSNALRGHLAFGESGSIFSVERSGPGRMHDAPYAFGKLPALPGSGRTSFRTRMRRRPAISTSVHALGRIPRSAGLQVFSQSSATASLECMSGGFSRDGRTTDRGQSRSSSHYDFPKNSDSIRKGRTF
jgi:hypothetical protein